MVRMARRTELRVIAPLAFVFLSVLMLQCEIERIGLLEVPG